MKTHPRFTDPVSSDSIEAQQSDQPPTTVIVGGVAGGMSTAARLRRRDEHRTIIVFEASGHVSFANCGLPYYVGGVIEERSSLLLQTPEALQRRFRIDVRIRHRVTNIDTETQIVTVHNLATGETITQHYDELVLSPGAQAAIPDIPGIEKAYTLRGMEDVDTITAAIAEKVQSAAIIGGGFIGLEMAENLVRRGLHVQVITHGPQILSPLDAEMAAIVALRLEENGVRLHTNATVTSITESGIKLENGDHIAADMVITAIGVHPDSSLASDAGLETNAQGGIIVDEYQRTSVPNIYALGDAAVKRDAISGEQTLIPLAQTANRHGRLIADIITGRNVKSLPTLGTAIIGVFGLSAASTGWNECKARTAGKNVRIVHVHPNDHANYYPGATQLHLKLVIDADTDAILGAQAVGENGVDKRIDVIATAMRAGMKASELADLELAYAPQFGSAKDPVNIAGMVADNRAQGQQSVQWHELTDSTQVIDVRTTAEYARGHIPGSLNIPLDNLRERFTEIDTSQPIVVTCQVGLRGNVATQIVELTQAENTTDASASSSTVNVANLDGGYLTFTHGQTARRLAAPHTLSFT